MHVSGRCVGSPDALAQHVRLLRGTNLGSIAPARAAPACLHHNTQQQTARLPLNDPSAAPATPAGPGWHHTSTSRLPASLR